VSRVDPEHLLDDLDPEQREAVRITAGPLVIHAGAGTGKTRVISHRAAYAVATGAVPIDQVLVVTFTEKAAGEMADRLRRLGLPDVTARTFHAHALRQLRHFWPSRHDGEPMPALLDSKIPILARIARGLPGHYRFTPAKDLAEEIEWAKSHRTGPRGYPQAATAAGREPPIPVDLFVRAFDGYERARVRAGRIDFDDLLTETVDLLETDRDAAALVRARKGWFSVDEYQDTNPLQQRLLELWLGDRRDLCVVGDEDQTIYAFAGASSSFLVGFADRMPGARSVTLVRNYRSTPQVLALANRLVAAEGRTKGLTATREAGSPPDIVRHATAADELAGIVAWIRDLVSRGTVAGEIAVLTRMNAQLEPIEDALTRAGIVYAVRGQAFYQRPEVRAALASLRRPGLAARGRALGADVRARWAANLGYEGEAAPGAHAPGTRAPGDGPPGGGASGDEALEQQASFETLLAIVDGVVRAEPDATAGRLVAELERRAAAEREGGGTGVNLLTLHRAKGLEWDAVCLPALEEGSLPIRQAIDDEPAIAEERRLLYVGITRARRHLRLSWAERRESRGRETRRRPSRFLLDLRERQRRTVRTLPGPPPRAQSPRAGTDADPLFAALRAWRTDRARAAATPPYVIAHDATLSAIAEAQPRTLAALRRIKGMGPARLERYGEEILEVTARVLGD
jgi:ATP-dependent DNA helicase UvrD/PcrA